jgi:hypothetical protein
MKRRRVVAAILLLSATALAACGNKTAVRAPEAIQPRPASALVASVVPGGVQLTWRRPTEYSGGDRMTDLGGFEIERAPYDAPAGFAIVGTLELDDQLRFRPQREVTWTDTTVVEGSRYLYRVTAFTLDGYRSRPAGPVAIQYDPRKIAPRAAQPARKVDPSRTGQ